LMNVVPSLSVKVKKSRNNNKKCSECVNNKSRKGIEDKVKEC
jgi:hypothetical protein